MSRTLHFQLQLTRTPLGHLGLSSQGDIRQWLQRGLVEQVVSTGHCQEVMRFLGDDFQDFLAADEDLGEGRDEAGTVIFRRLAEREDIRRSFREGQIRLFEDGHWRRATCLLELTDPLQERWWVAWRVFQSRDGAGIFSGPWMTLEGQGVRQLPSSLRLWLDCEHATVEYLQTELQPVQVPAPRIQVGFADLEGELPVSNRALAAWLGQRLDPEILSDGLDGFLAFFFRPGSIERWEVRGVLPCRVKDFLRTVARQGEIHGVALVQPCVAEMQDRHYPGYSITVQRGPWKTVRILPVAKGGAMAQPLAPVYPGSALVVPDDDWLGVPPEVSLDLQPESAVGIMGVPPVPEA